jgi:two-component system, response regulator PdtaR
MRSYLIVDDNRALAENLAEIIRDRGDEAKVATSGQEALALVGQERFDALLTDMRMPAMNGADLVREVRRQDPGMPAIVITAFSNDAGIRAAQQEGPLAVLAKPVPVPELLRLLGAARRNGRVILIEDDQVLADNLTEILQGQGFSVIGLADVSAIDDVPPVPPLLGIADLRVPGAPDGVAARRLADRFPGLPIIVLTGHREIAPPVEAYRLFLKPFDTAQLVAAIERLHGGASARG